MPLYTIENHTPVNKHPFIPKLLISTSFILKMFWTLPFWWFSDFLRPILSKGCYTVTQYRIMNIIDLHVLPLASCAFGPVVHQYEIPAINKQDIQEMSILLTDHFIGIMETKLVVCWYIVPWHKKPYNKPGLLLIDNWNGTGMYCFKLIWSLLPRLQIDLVWSMFRRRVTRRLTRLQTVCFCFYILCHGLKTVFLHSGLKRIGSGSEKNVNLISCSTVWITKWLTNEVPELRTNGKTNHLEYITLVVFRFIRS